MYSGVMLFFRGVSWLVSGVVMGTVFCCVWCSDGVSLRVSEVL